MVAPKLGHAAYNGPSIIKEIFYGMTIALAAGYLWKRHHWNEQSWKREFYDLLDAGEITVVVNEDE